MQAVYDYLRKNGKEAEIGEEETYNMAGLCLNEPVIRLKNNPLASISLFLADGISCAITGGILRFHYLVKIPGGFKSNEEKRLTASTKLLRENRLLGMFGGKISAVNWVGRDLAVALNRDEELNRELLGCATTTGEIDFTIDTIRPDEVHIWGPRFSDPLGLSTRFKAMDNRQEHVCIFCVNTIERIAGNILDLLQKR